jgi:hypothetical protein
MKRRELPTGFRNLGLGILDGGKNVARPQVIGLAFRRERHAPRSAMKQTHAKPGFEPGDELGNSGRRDAEVTCGCGEATPFDHTDKGPQVTDLGHSGLQVINLVPEGPIMALWRQEYHPEWSIRGFGP